ncbi:unnamed protein product [Protopolystoma xenopodis]|uniref:Uncharacterized protein n=1 Tax=Protopolystoma xenopodis TaxID=117903 RepID=A0A3S5CIF2_9PLAT|nr:unnamed protein product [Protopolystoma xenopodis]
MLSRAWFQFIPTLNFHEDTFILITSLLHPKSRGRIKCSPASVDGQSQHPGPSFWSTSSSSTPSQSSPLLSSSPNATTPPLQAIEANHSFANRADDDSLIYSHFTANSSNNHTNQIKNNPSISFSDSSSNDLFDSHQEPGHLAPSNRRSGHSPRQHANSTRKPSSPPNMPLASSQPEGLTADGAKFKDAMEPKLMDELWSQECHQARPDPNYLAHPEDTARIVEAISWLHKVFNGWGRVVMAAAERPEFSLPGTQKEDPTNSSRLFRIFLPNYPGLCRI